MSVWANTHPLEVVDLHVVARQQDANSDFDSSYVNLSKYDKVAFLVSKPAGTAGDDISLSLLQADASSGGNTKAINFDEVYHKVGGAATWTRDQFTATNDYDTGATPNSADLAADTSAAEFLVVVRNDQLDAANGYKFVFYRNEGDDVGNALLVNVTAMLYGPRYAKLPPLTPAS